MRGSLRWVKDRWSALLHDEGVILPLSVMRGKCDVWSGLGALFMVIRWERFRDCSTHCHSPFITNLPKPQQSSCCVLGSLCIGSINVQISHAWELKPVPKTQWGPIFFWLLCNFCGFSFFFYKPKMTVKAFKSSSLWIIHILIWLDDESEMNLRVLECLLKAFITCACALL